MSEPFYKRLLYRLFLKYVSSIFYLLLGYSLSFFLGYSFTTFCVCKMTSNMYTLFIRCFLMEVVIGNLFTFNFDFTYGDVYMLTNF